MSHDPDSKLMQEFYYAFDKFMYEWRKKEGMHGGIIIPLLIGEAKLEACFYHGCYTQMVGMLSQALHEDLKEMFNDINQDEEKDPADTQGE